MTENFFANIHLFLPKLQYLNIKTMEDFSDYFILSFNSLKNIQRVKYKFVNWAEKSEQINCYYFDKCLIEVMLSPNGMNVKHITHNCGLIIEEKPLKY